MAGSLTTTTFTGVQIGGDQDYDTRAVIDSSSGGILMPLSTSTPVDAVVGVADGAFSFTSHSANSVVLAFRSGGTVYEFWNDAGS
jgi:hypothetical protein